jgi:hypothetical protein
MKKTPRLSWLTRHTFFLSSAEQHFNVEVINVTESCTADFTRWIRDLTKPSDKYSVRSTRIVIPRTETGHVCFERNNSRFLLFDDKFKEWHWLLWHMTLLRWRSRFFVILLRLLIWHEALAMIYRQQWNDSRKRPCVSHHYNFRTTISTRSCRFLLLGKQGFVLELTVKQNARVSVDVKCYL